MKTVTLNDAGYTADGKWRLVLVEPLEKEVIALREMVAELQVKADRYDFLARKVCITDSVFYFLNTPYAPENWHELKPIESLDIAIDAAIDAARGGV